jgi:iron complex transport system substrate-binding protein
LKCHLANRLGKAKQPCSLPLQPSKPGDLPERYQQTSAENGRRMIARVFALSGRSRPLPPRRPAAVRLRGATFSFLQARSRSVVLCALLAAIFLLLNAVGAQALPQRIVSTSPSVTEILFALGLGPQVVGVSNYCEYPEEVNRLPRVGSYLRPDPELIARLHPDLVIVHKLPNGLTGRLAALQIPFAEVDRGTLQDTYVEIRQIGKSAGVEARAEVLVNRIQARLQQIHQQSEGLKSPSIVFVVHHTSGTLSDLVVVGRDSFMNEIIEAAGGTNVMALASLPAYPHVGLEAMIRSNPDVILDLGDRGDGPQDRERKAVADEALWRAVPGLAAAKAGRIYCLTSTVFTTPGPRTPEAAELLFSMLHGRKPQ